VKRCPISPSVQTADPSVSGGATGIQIRCYMCTKTSAVSGVILGEVDFLAGAQARVEAMIARARERANKAAKRTNTAR
jgi:hypothetical protein